MTKQSTEKTIQIKSWLFETFNKTNPITIRKYSKLLVSGGTKGIQARPYTHTKRTMKEYHEWTLCQ